MPDSVPLTIDQCLLDVPMPRADRSITNPNPNPATVSIVCPPSSASSPSRLFASSHPDGALWDHTGNPLKRTEYWAGTSGYPTTLRYDNVYRQPRAPWPMPRPHPHSAPVNLPNSVSCL